MDLEELGYGADYQRAMADAAAGSWVPARVIAQGQDRYRLAGSQAQLGELSGRLLHTLEGSARPVVGDWVAVEDHGDSAIIHAVLPRRTELSRRAAGSDTRAQVIAANVDVFFIVTSVGRDFNPRRIERYLAAVWESGALPFIVINKADLADDPQVLEDELAAVAPGTTVVTSSALYDDDLVQLRNHIERGKTIALIGSSGVGKSTLTNRLLGEGAQAVQELRSDGKGRHTTTHRELFMLEGGGMLIDTPGMRELGLLDHHDGVEAGFADIAGLAEQCKFRDCQHGGEPGCAVTDAIDRGELEPTRLDDYRHLQRELAAAARKSDPKQRSKDRWKDIHKAMRARSKVDPKRTD